MATIVQTQVGQWLLTAKPTKGVLQLPVLDEEIVLRIQPLSGLWTLEIEGEPLLDPGKSRSRSQIQKERKVKYDGSSQNGIAAKEVELDLHGVAHPPDDIDVVPSLLAGLHEAGSS